MKAEKLHSVYLIGIGGIGMSALARWYKMNGSKVAGYDRTSTPLTTELIHEGIAIHFEDNIKLIPEEFKSKDTYIIYTPAIPADSNELQYFLQNKFEVVKRSQALGEITKKCFTIAVAGTHGKTTTSSMIAHILIYAQKNCIAFLGGIIQNYHTNILLGTKADELPVMVVEADEYDRSFLTLHPNIAVVTAIDPDHLDIYHNETEFVKAFEIFLGQVKDQGSIVYKQGLQLTIPAQVRSESFGLTEADFVAVVENEPIFNFDIRAKNQKYSIKNINLIIPGFHNIQNALAAYVAAVQVGIEPSIIKEGLESFKGVKRRFEYIVRNDKFIFIDDYAHHPTEIHAVLSSIIALYKKRKITAVFQPHLFSRTKDFMQGFADTLSLANEVILLEIYPARELPIENISSGKLLEKIKSERKYLLSKEELISFIENNSIEVLITMGAGDIDQLVLPISEILNHKKQVML